MACDADGAAELAALRARVAELERERDEARVGLGQKHQDYRDLYAMWCRVARALTPEGGPDITDEQVVERVERSEADLAIMRGNAEAWEEKCQDAWREADRDEAACASMRAALEEVKIRIIFIGHPGEPFREDGQPDWVKWLRQIDDALFSPYDAGRGWVSPEQAAAMRAALEKVDAKIREPVDPDAEPWYQDATKPWHWLQEALATDAGKGWVSPEQAASMRTALRNAAGTLRFVIQRGHESGQPSAWIREPAEWCDAALAEKDGDE